MDRISVIELRDIGCSDSLSNLTDFAWWLASHGITSLKRLSQTADKQNLSQFDGIIPGQLLWRCGASRSPLTGSSLVPQHLMTAALRFVDRGAAKAAQKAEHQSKKRR